MVSKLSLAPMRAASSFFQAAQIPAAGRLSLATGPAHAAPLHLLRQRHDQLSRYSTIAQTPRSATTCPSCGTSLPPAIIPTCPSCSTILPPPHPSTSFYDLFGLDPSFSIDQKALKREFLKYQQKVHPDMFTGEGEKEVWAKAWSRGINDAYRALEKDLSRGEYLLSLQEVTIGEADSVADPELLMMIMETREALEEASTESEVATIREENQTNIDETLEKLKVAFGTDPPELEEAKDLVVRLRYLQNVEGVCKEWQPGKRIELQH